MNFGMNHARGAGSIARPVDLQSSVLPLCYRCPEAIYNINNITSLPLPLTYVYTGVYISISMYQVRVCVCVCVCIHTYSLYLFISVVTLKQNDRLL